MKNLIKKKKRNNQEFKKHLIKKLNKKKLN